MNGLIDILLIEDDRDDIELLEDALRDNAIKFNLSVIMQGDKILPWLEKLNTLPDLIILDLTIPKLHGKESLLLLKTNERLNSIPVVVLSTSTSATERDFCLKNGALHFLSKPTTAEGFKEVVQVIVNSATKKNISES
jgi:DNA-binding response OmpR family regulator